MMKIVFFIAQKQHKQHLTYGYIFSISTFYYVSCFMFSCFLHIQLGSFYTLR